jgi:hypothetical protein
VVSMTNIRKDMLGMLAILVYAQAALFVFTVLAASVGCDPVECVTLQCSNCLGVSRIPVDRIAPPYDLKPGECGLAWKCPKCNRISDQRRREIQ